MDDLTARQRRILDVIRATVRERGYPPTVREIGEAVGLTSSSSVHSQLANLERRGLLHKDPTQPRAIGPAAQPSDHPGGPIPPLRRVAPRPPGPAPEHVEGYPAVPRGVAPRN